MRIAIAQHQVVPGDVETNRETVLSLLREALSHRPDVVLFPEEMLVGYAAHSPSLAEPLSGGTTVGLVQAELHGSQTRALLGLTESGEDGSRWITAVLVGAEGVIARYRKTHLWSATPGLRHEPTWYRPGEELVTFEIGGDRCGVMICYDGAFPEMTRAYADLGCTVLFWLNNRLSRGPQESHHLAVDNSMVMAVSCCCGPDETGEHAGGGSHVTDHDGTVLAERWDEPGIIVADVEAGKVPAVRARNPLYAGRRTGLYGRYLVANEPARRSWG